MATTATAKPTAIAVDKPAPSTPSAKPKSKPWVPWSSRKVSEVYSSPGGYGRESEEVIVYELSPRHLSAGYAGEGRPRCIWRFGYTQNENLRVGDYSHLDQRSNARPRFWRPAERKHYEIYSADLRDIDLTLVHARLERAIRTIHLDELQLDPKTRRAALVVSPLTPTKILDLVLGILFNHYSLTPSVTLLTSPVMSCVGAGVRDALVIDIGWEETIVTAVAEYKSVLERRSIRGGRMLVQAYADLLKRQLKADVDPSSITFALAEDVRDRLAWCKAGSADFSSGKTIAVPLSNDANVEVPFEALSEAVEASFFTQETTPSHRVVSDDNELPIHVAAYKVLQALSRDQRGICASRIIIAEGHSRIPGLRRRILELMQALIDDKGWSGVFLKAEDDTPRASVVLPDDFKLSSSIATVEPVSPEEKTPATPSSIGSPQSLRSQKHVPASERRHDDAEDKLTQKAERDSVKRRIQPFSGQIRGVDSLGAWAGASMVASMRIKGTCEVEREDFLKHGLRDSAALLI